MQEKSFALGKAAIPETRKQVAGDKEFGGWNLNEYIRYFALLANLNVMSYRNIFREAGDKPQALKDIYMMVDLYKNGFYTSERGESNEHQNENQTSFSKAYSPRR